MFGDTFLDSELYLSSPRKARLSCAGREYEGAVALDDALRERLRALELLPDDYGAELFQAVFPPQSALHQGLRAARERAENENKRLRLRLCLSHQGVDPALHALYWELLRDPERKEALSRTQGTVFSRYSTVAHDPGQPTSRRPRLLCVISAPSDIAAYGMAEIDHAALERSLRKSFGLIASRMKVDFLAPPATPERLRQRLMSERFHVLHICGHGRVVREGESKLVLENDDGTARFVGESTLVEIVKDDQHVRLVTLITCHGGALSGADSFSGLAGRLVESGCPAVIAMRRAVTLEMADDFTQHLYRVLSQTARVDVAVSEARHQVYLKESQRSTRGVAWSSPILFMRLPDALLWKRISWASRAFLAATLLFLALLLVASVCRVDEAEVDLDLKTSRLSFVLAEAQPVIDRFRLAELAVSHLDELRLPRSLGETPNPILAKDLAPQPLGLFLRTTAEAASITLQETPIAQDTRVIFEHGSRRPLEYRVSVDGSGVRTFADLEGELFLKLLHRPKIDAVFPTPEQLELATRDRGIELELRFARLVGDEIHQPLAIHRLGLIAIEEQQLQGSARETRAIEVSTIEGGTITVVESGRRHELRPKERFDVAASRGSLYKLRLHEDHIEMGFRGQVSRPTATVPDGQTVDLRPTWLTVATGSERTRLLLAAGFLAVALAIWNELRPEHVAHLFDSLRSRLPWGRRASRPT